MHALAAQQSTGPRTQTAMTFSNTRDGSRVDFRASFVSRFKGSLEEIDIEQLFCYGYIKTLRVGKVWECRLEYVGKRALRENRSKLEIALTRGRIRPFCGYATYSSYLQFPVQVCFCSTSSDLVFPVYLVHFQPKKGPFFLLWPWSFWCVTLTYAFDLGKIKMIYLVKYLGQRSFYSTVVMRTHTHTHTHTAYRLYYTANKAVGAWKRWQVVKVIWHKVTSPPQTDGSIVFARCRQCALP